MYRQYTLQSHFPDGSDEFLDCPFISTGGGNFGLRGDGDCVFHNFLIFRCGGSGFDVTWHGSSDFYALLDDGGFDYLSPQHGGSGFDSPWRCGSGFGANLGGAFGFDRHVDDHEISYSSSQCCGSSFDAGAILPPV
jgi:hypothetical protein